MAPCPLLGLSWYGKKLTFNLSSKIDPVLSGAIVEDFGKWNEMGSFKSQKVR